TVLPAGGYQVFVEDAAKFATQFPNVVNYTGPLGFGLSGDGDVLRLYDAQGILQNSLCYDDAAPWDEDADGFGYTLENIDFEGTQNDAGNWLSGCLGGSPGTAYDPDCIEVATSEAEEMGIAVFPNPVNDVLNVHLNNPARLRLLDGLGRVVLSQWAQGAAELPMGRLAAGAYWLQVVDETGKGLHMPILLVKQ
ncbi:MAG: T9SS type A sorting domain-containing protein, partial [Saprospiraceae bacterium]|nr:T9SS type A sorting domain-containing protein [Saprospiraceae bacterium]